MTDEQAQQAAETCPVGAILVKEKGFVDPIGQRKYDNQSIGSEIENLASVCPIQEIRAAALAIIAIARDKEKDNTMDLDIVDSFAKFDQDHLYCTN